MQQIAFMKNLAITGGLFFVIAHGPGAYSLDRGTGDGQRSSDTTDAARETHAPQQQAVRQ